MNSIEIFVRQMLAAPSVPIRITKAKPPAPGSTEELVLSCIRQQSNHPNGVTVREVAKILKVAATELRDAMHWLRNHSWIYSKEQKNGVCNSWLAY